MQLIFLLPLIYQSKSTSTRRLLQIPHTLTSNFMGSYGQVCQTPSSDWPCQMAGMPLSDQFSGTLECGLEYGCCLCESIVCGSITKYCDSFKADALSAVFGVQDIRVYGQPQTSGAVLDCGAQLACAGAIFIGSWVDTIQCLGEQACNAASFDFLHSNGLICGKEGCIQAKFNLQQNIGGTIQCGAERACVGAIIQTNAVENVVCNGQSSCQNAKITITNPLEHFHLVCNGYLACENMELELLITACMGAPVTEFKGISCGTGGGCEGMKFTIVNNGCSRIVLEDLQCDPGRACYGAVFNFNAGNSVNGLVEIKNCHCGPSCRHATGIDQCFQNIRTLECPDVSSCASQKRTIINPSNDFLLLCSNTEACLNFDLTIILSGASQNLVRRFAGFDCAASKSCKNAVINVVNTQMMGAAEVVKLYIADILCTASGSCDGTTFILSENVHVQRVICTQGACNGCLIKQAPDDIGLPCDTTTTTTAVPAMILPSPSVETATTTSTSAPIATTIAPRVSTIPPRFLPSIPSLPAAITTSTISPRFLPSIPSIPATPANPVTPASPNQPIPNQPQNPPINNQGIPQYLPIR